MDALRTTWSKYPSDWASNPQLNLGVETLGDEWGGPEFADHIVELVAGHLGPTADVLELGCGGGKFSQRIAPRCRSLVCTDISPAMLAHTRAGLTERGIDDNVTYAVLNGIAFDGIPADSVDFIFSYDVQLHLQPQNVFSYLVDARRVLREGGTIMLHQISLPSEGGIRHFIGQYVGDTWKRDFDDPRRRGHIYFMSEDQMQALADEAGLAVDHVVTDHGVFESVTSGRDLIGFLERRRSRLDGVPRPSVDLIRPDGENVVYAVVGGTRYGFRSGPQFERDGFDWSRVRVIEPAELGALEDGGLLEPWE